MQKIKLLATVLIIVAIELQSAHAQQPVTTDFLAVCGVGVPRTSAEGNVTLTGEAETFHR
jgi:hypothetical protein